MEQRVRIFIDFWNFQLNWNPRSKIKCDWEKLPSVLLKKANDKIQKGGINTNLILEGIRCYVSYSPEKDAGLKRCWIKKMVRYPS